MKTPCSLLSASFTLVGSSLVGTQRCCSLALGEEGLCRVAASLDRVFSTSESTACVACCPLTTGKDHKLPLV